MDIEFDYIEREHDRGYTMVGLYDYNTVYDKRPEDTFEADVAGLFSDHPEWNASVDHYGEHGGVYNLRTFTEGARVQFGGDKDALEECIVAIKDMGYGTPDKTHFGSILHPIESAKSYFATKSVIKEHKVKADLIELEETHNGYYNHYERVMTWNDE